MKEYLKKSFERSLMEKKEYQLHEITVYILQSLPEHIDVNRVLSRVKDLIPYELMKELDGIYVGDFPRLKDRNIQAMLKDNVIYLSSYKEIPDITEESIVNDIVHECGHLLEDRLHYDIYEDKSIENEYVGKKKRLVGLLRAGGVSFHGMGKLFFSSDMVDELDNFLFNELGYDNIIGLSTGLFSSPYSITSIREYFANGFQEYINGDRNYLKEISPNLYNRIHNLMEEHYDKF